MHVGRLAGKAARVGSAVVQGMLIALALLSGACRISESPDDSLRAWIQKQDPPALPAAVPVSEVWYQFFLLPRSTTAGLHPVIITLDLQLDADSHAQGGRVQVHARKGGSTQRVGMRRLSADEAGKMLSEIGTHEIFSLPLRWKPSRYEGFPQMDGSTYVLIRKDQAGQRMIIRQDWSSAPVSSVARRFMSYAIPYFR